MKQSSVFGAFFLLGVASSLTAGGPYLKTYADPCGINVGTAVVWSAFNSGPQVYRDTIEQNFNLVEPENEMKWGEIRPNQATFNYTKSDTVINWALARGMKARGHVLAWHQDNPNWLVSGGFTPAQLNSILRTHIQTVMPHYAGRVYAWDVVNEAFNEDGTLRQSIWHGNPGIGLPGTQWIEQAFVWARAADPSTKLYYNDYNIEPAGYAKADAVYAMAQDFVNRGVPIDGIGLQMHVVAGSGWPSAAAIRTQINRIAALGLDVEITEMDVRIQEPVDAAKLAQQAATAQAIIDACLDNPRCKTVQWWGHTDNYSWIPATFPGYNDGLLLDRSYNIKPVYTTFLNELNRPCLNPPGSLTPTRTSTPVPFTELFDDFEDGNTGNNWGGTWTSYAGGASAVTLTVAGPGAPGSTIARANVTGNIGDYGGITAGFSTATRDISSYVGIQFLVRGSGTHWWQAPQTSIADGDHFGASFTATGSWTTVTIFFNTLNQRGFGAASTFNPAIISSFQWASNANGAFSFEIDDVRLLTYNPPSTATRTATRTPTRTASPTPTRTASPSATRTASPSATRTASPSATPTATPTGTPTRSSTPSSSPTATPLLATMTPTLTASPSVTRSTSPTSSPTSTPGAGSPTVSSTMTLTATPSATASATGTHTASPTVTGTPFGSPSPSATATLNVLPPPPTGTRTLSASPTRTPTGTASPSASPTATRTASSTGTPTPNATATATPALPAVISLSPAMPVAVGVTLTVQGSNFAPGAQVVINGSAYAANWASPTSLSLLVPNLPAGSHSLTVRNPDGSESAAGPALVIAGPAPSATPDPAGPLVIERAVPFPNPGPRSIAIQLAGPAQRVTLKVYTSAWVLVGAHESGPLAKGWVRLPLPEALSQAPWGLYYFAVQAEHDGRTSQAFKGRFYRLP